MTQKKYNSKSFIFNLMHIAFNIILRKKKKIIELHWHYKLISEIPFSRMHLVNFYRDYKSLKSNIRTQEVINKSS